MGQRVGHPPWGQCSYSVPLLPAGGSAGCGIMLPPAPSTSSRRCWRELWDIPWPLSLISRRECCAGSHDWSNPAIPVPEATEGDGVQQGNCSYYRSIIVQQKDLAPFWKMRDLLDSQVFGCLVHSDIFLLGGVKGTFILLYLDLLLNVMISHALNGRISSPGVSECVCVSLSLSVSLSTV